MAEIPPAAIMAAATAIERELLSGRDYSMAQDSDEALARVALEAAAPILERAMRRKIAREILHLDEVDRALTRSKGPSGKGPYGDMRTSLRRLMRGEPLPGACDLREGGKP